MEPEVVPPEVRRAQRTILWDGVFSRFMDAMTGGAFLAGLALYLGADTFLVALIAALPFLAQVAQVFAVQLLMRARNRRRIVVITSTTARLTFILVAVLVYVWGRSLGAWTLFGILAFSSLVMVVSNAAWNWWMRDVMPRSALGRYFGRRLQITASIAAVATPLAGLSLDYFEVRGQAEIGYAILFGLGGFAGLVSSFFLSITPHPEAPPLVAPTHAWRAMFEPMKVPATRRLALALMLVAATLTISFPFTAVFMLRSLGYSFFPVAMLSLVSQVAYVGSLRSWGYLSDRFGNRPVLMISIGMVIAALAGWSFAWGGTPAALFGLLVVLHFLSGFSVAGIDLTAHNVLLKTAPEQGAPAYMAAISMSRAIVAGIATLLAGAAWQLIGIGPIVQLEVVAGLDWTIRGFHVLTLTSTVVGLFAVLALRRVEEPGHAPVLEVARAMRREVRMMSSVPGIRAFVHAVSYAVEFFAQERRPEPPTIPKVQDEWSGPDALDVR